MSLARGLECGGRDRIDLAADIARQTCVIAADGETEEIAFGIELKDIGQGPDLSRPRVR
jgi:hypothetical protein